jgi:hypothetical protein
MRHKFTLFEKETNTSMYNIDLILVHPWYNYICISPEFLIRYDNPKNPYGWQTIFQFDLFFLFGFGFKINKLIKE